MYLLNVLSLMFGLVVFGRNVTAMQQTTECIDRIYPKSQQPSEPLGSTGLMTAFRAKILNQYREKNGKIFLKQQQDKENTGALKKTNLQDLPAEILVMIASCLAKQDNSKAAAQDYTNLRSTSKRFYSVLHPEFSKKIFIDKGAEVPESSESQIFQLKPSKKKDFYIVIIDLSEEKKKGISCLAQELMICRFLKSQKNFPLNDKKKRIFFHVIDPCDQRERGSFLYNIFARKSCVCSHPKKDISAFPSFLLSVQFLEILDHSVLSKNLCLFFEKTPCMKNVLNNFSHRVKVLLPNPCQRLIFTFPDRTRHSYILTEEIQV